jgi:hypothetical protein
VETGVLGPGVGSTDAGRLAAGVESGLVLHECLSAVFCALLPLPPWWALGWPAGPGWSLVGWALGYAAAHLDHPVAPPLAPTPAS